MYNFSGHRLAKVFKPDKTKFWRSHGEMEILCSAYEFVNWDKYTIEHFDSNKQSKCALMCVSFNQAALLLGA